MRLLPAVLVTSIISYSAFGQNYTISTVAGGGQPVNIPGTSASLGSTHLTMLRLTQQAMCFSWTKTTSCDWTPQQVS